MDLKSKIILISGPTASGKSKFALKLAKKIDGEIRRAVSKWLPYIIIKNINSVIEDGGSTNTVTVVIKFSTTLDPTSSEELQLTPTS